jgi:hypothetical protein
MCASNPALFTCNIIWFDQLQSSSLRSISSELISKALPEFSRATLDEISNLISETQKFMEEKYKVSQRHFYTTIFNFIHIFNSKSKSKKEQGNHLQKGL